MIFFTMNFGVLRSWIWAHSIADTAMLAPFGLTADELHILTTATLSDLSAWSAVATPLVQPRPDLLAALHELRDDEIYGFIAGTRTKDSNPTLDRLPAALNEIVLDSWSQALRTGERLDRFELDSTEADALRQLSPALRREWASLPLAIAVPKPRLIHTLRCNDSALLLSFTKPWNEENGHRRATGSLTSVGPTHATSR